jgi:predicted PurR-regulated permease PerM
VLLRAYRAIWIAFRWIGLDNARAWAIVAGLLHVVLYLSAVATTVRALVTTWMTGRIARMNPAAALILLLFRVWL